MHTNTNRRFNGHRWWPTFFASAYAPNVFEQRLAQLARRLQRKQTLNKAPREIAIVFVATIILGLLISSLIGTQITTMIGAAVVGASAVTLIGRAFVIPSPPTTALAYDRQLDLHERLSTSVTDELRTDSAIQTLQRKDAVRTIETIDAAGAFPYALRRVDLLLLVASTASWGLVIPNSDELRYVATNRHELQRIATLTGGTTIESAKDLMSLPRYVNHSFFVGWQHLLTIALMAFVADVGVRRIRDNPRRLGSRIGERVRSSRVVVKPLQNIRWPFTRLL